MFRWKRFFLVINVLLGSIALLATDIYLPALPELATYFNCSQTEVQSSFTFFLVGLAACQLVYGALADRFGRKKIIFLGLSLFTVASILCVYSTTLPQFLICRFLQAIGAGVGSVINRVLITDRFDKTESVKIFSTIFPIIGLSAAIGPAIGGYLTTYFGWQSVFYFMAGYGVLVLALVSVGLKETQRKPVQTSGTRSITRLSDFTGLFSNVNFLGYTFIISASFAAFRCYSVESPFVFDSQGFVAEDIGLFYITLSAAYVIGNLIAKKLVNQFAMDKVLYIGVVFFVLGGAIMVASSLYFGDSPYAIILPMTIITFGNGFLFPTGSAGAMSSVSETVSGKASGVFGALQFITAAICVHWVGDICQGAAFRMSICIAAISLACLCSYRFLVFRPKAVVTPELETE